jgi:hypothetical protein
MTKMSFPFAGVELPPDATISVPSVDHSGSKNCGPVCGLVTWDVEPNADFLGDELADGGAEEVRGRGGDLVGPHQGEARGALRRGG